MSALAHLDFAVFGPLLFSLGLIATSLLLAKDFPAQARIFSAVLCIFLAVRYIWWRLEYSIPQAHSFLQLIWIWSFLVIEILTVVSTITCLIFMSRTKTRHPPDILPDDFASAPVDIFIATYNEPYDVLERTLVGATNVDHANLRVWVLDDGARDWVRALAEEFGAFYVHRVKGKHAKAGNINNGLAQALKTSRPPEYILLLDADFVPFRTILKRTLGLFAEADVGIVQTPQHFFNPDPIQRNLICSTHWPDEQRFFFETLLSCKDAWGAAFCCGTSAVFRVKALVAARGMATETVTEDMLTTFKLSEYGYRTIFLNEQLSMGLAPEDLGSYVSQRARWCLGAVQQVYTRWSFAGRAKIGFINRLSSLDGTLYWISNAPFKLLMILGPPVFWWTGAAVIKSTLGDLIVYLAPCVLCSMIFTFYYSAKRVLPIMADVTQLLSSFAIVGTVAVGLVKPWGHPFRVTAKGGASDKATIHWRILTPFLAMLIATIGGVYMNVSQFSALYGADGFDVNIFWSLFNVIVLTIACAVCIDLPQRRRSERFSVGDQAVIRLPNGLQAPCVIRDISLGGANIGLAFGRLRMGDSGVLIMGNGLEVGFDLVRDLSDGYGVRFHEDKATRRSLIVRLFTGHYSKNIETIKTTQVFGAIFRRLSA